MNPCMYLKAKSRSVPISFTNLLFQNMWKIGGREGDLGYIAENAAGEPIGSITVRYFREGNPGFGYVSSEVPELGMAILPAYRGQGLGTSLMKQMFAGLREQRIDRVSLSVDPENAAAVKLYQRFGFKPVGEVGTSITMLAQVIHSVHNN
ncbi:GNAT family N-acetyltransferase [Paenibacillus alvei]|uniref:GNAT family N-acetyltransferase n=1 Tax=Paenibacillus alvei TaxID=44250 RepID=UPI003D2BBDF4